MPKIPHDSNVVIRPISTQSSNLFPLISDPFAKAKGIVIIARPAINIGGWLNIPGCNKRGLIPIPSTTSLFMCSKGLAKKAKTKI